MALGIIPAFIWIGGALISSGVIARWWRETGPEDVSVVGKYISDPSQFTGEVPMPNVFVTAASPQVQQQLKGAWSPAQRAEVDRAEWESGRLDMLPSLPSFPGGVFGGLPGWALPVAVGLGAFLLLRR